MQSDITYLKQLVAPQKLYTEEDLTPVSPVETIRHHL